MKDYRKLVSREAPEGLVAFASTELDTAGLIYESVWMEDESVDAVLTERPRKVRAVKCTCSACGGSVIADYIPKAPAYSGRNVYGFSMPVCQGMEEMRDGDSMLCPMCGVPVAVKCVSKFRKDFVTGEAMVLAASLLPGEPGERPLVLAGWRVRRKADRSAKTSYEVAPWEAYVFEKNAAYKLMGWVTSYSGSCAYFRATTREWRQPRDWHETWGQCRDIFGLTPELVAESCLPNCKLDIYMQKDFRHKWKSPVPYLRLYQFFPQIENLVVQGCCHILDDLMTERMPTHKWEHNCRGMMDLSGDLDLSEVRPAQMLRLDKDEFAEMRSAVWDTYHWKTYVAAKEVGDRMKLPEDMETLHQYGGEDIAVMIGKAPLGKCLRYLMKQIYLLCVLNDPYNEYEEDIYVDGEEISAQLLSDYWDMAGACGWNLDDPAVRWPKDLITAHDGVMLAYQFVQDEQTRALFKPRFHELGKYAYASGGLMIFPAASLNAMNLEGEKLHHCVARYSSDHVKGDTAIFFIRHTWEYGKPYFTLELNEKELKVKQDRGDRNCARTPEVAEFEAEWLAWVRGGCQRLKDGTPVGARPVLREDPAKAESREEKKTA